MQQAFGKARQAFEGGFHLGGTGFSSRIGGFRLQALRLGNCPGQRGTQLVGGIGRKAALGFESGREAQQQAIERLGHRGDLGRQPLCGHRRQIARTARGQAVAQSAQWGQVGAHHPHNRQQRQRYHHQQRQNQAHLNFAGHGLAVGQWFSHRQAHAALQGFFAVEAVRRGLAQAHPRPGGKIGGIGRVGQQQHTPLCIAHDVGQQFIMFAHFCQALDDAIVFTLEHLRHSQRQDALCRFLQTRIEHFLHRMARQQRGDGRRSQPEQRQQHPQSEQQTPLQAARQVHAVPSR